MSGSNPEVLAAREKVRQQIAALQVERTKLTEGIESRNELRAKAIKDARELTAKRDRVDAEIQSLQKQPARAED